MKKFLLILSVFTLSLFAMLSCQQKTSKESKVMTLTGGSWPEQMQNLADILSALIPYINSSFSFSDPKNFKVIDENVDKLSKLSHNLSEKQAAPDQDPSLNLISTQFQDEIQRAVEAIKLGHRDYARHLLKSSTSYCIQCHTRNSSGPNFLVGRFSSALSTMTPLDRGEFFAATRQFDKALDEYKSVLKTQPGKDFNIIAWERSARHALAISVRFMNNPTQALEITELILSAPHAPLFLKEDAQEWKKTISQWQKEKNNIIGLNSTEALQLAKKQIEKAQKVQEYSTDHAGDIYYLQATSLLHSALAQGLKNQQKSEALYFIGIAYDSLRDLNFWTLHEQYYEACIRTSPHTAIAAKCIKNYEESILFGFSGSAGFLLPADVQIKLSELKALSTSIKHK